MPLYDYKCQKCGHRFEKIQKFSDSPVRKCPKCGGKVEKMISAPAFHFKGSGFYGTDYKKSGESSSSLKGSDDGGSASNVESSASPAKEAKESKESQDSKPKKAESPEKKSSKK